MCITDWACHWNSWFVSRLTTDIPDIGPIWLTTYYSGGITWHSKILLELIANTLGLEFKNIKLMSVRIRKKNIAHGTLPAICGRVQEAVSRIPFSFLWQAQVWEYNNSFLSIKIPTTSSGGAMSKLQLLRIQFGYVEAIRISGIPMMMLPSLEAAITCINSSLLLQLVSNTSIISSKTEETKSCFK